MRKHKNGTLTVISEQMKVAMKDNDNVPINKIRVLFPTRKYNRY